MITFEQKRLFFEKFTKENNLYDPNKRPMQTLTQIKQSKIMNESENSNKQVETKPEDLLAKIVIENDPNREVKVEENYLVASSVVLKKEENSNHQIENLINIIKETKLDNNFEVKKTLDPNEAKRILGN